MLLMCNNSKTVRMQYKFEKSDIINIALAELRTIFLTNHFFLIKPYINLKYNFQQMAYT